MKITMKHMYILPSGLLGTHWPWLMTLKWFWLKTLDLRPGTSRQKQKQVWLNYIVVWPDPANPRREQRPAPPFSVMACLVGCKIDTDETPNYAYAKSYWSLMEGSRPTLTDTVGMTSLEVVPMSLCFNWIKASNSFSISFNWSFSCRTKSMNSSCLVWLSTTSRV